ncbi:MAG: 16S rRNA (uracil(1498)-N(3))-methyltransferase [Deltaproteobacteria bacterium CG_4_10_14_0_2_um_filter_43_8]|nr:MAG: 16S rRNA (uracil(1498)-N(3))-methyltransferase [Deltaproteobacteria bacterium CG11_big_fil_rev_8_21_14_0_20_42_23]PJA20618.1 MAG: 16S rRNA (uracil(1498)-N(3))-methyltransferase [Deltaproteobacteria bacterium CG_4_10_14_0_2_um_filter_43_8]PJC65226.1 MAG: 16S rRNA (uracil(1498)-N(3))-methyltransferase [Deltaproteobacteria bacterium CG_4_9_14_0_2_um_filter_42_21]
MPHFFVNKKLETGKEYALEEQDAKHIALVLRLKRGDAIALSSGDGKTYAALLTTVDKKQVVAFIEDERPASPLKHLPSLAQAVVKHDRIEWIIQKAVELGTLHIFPFTSERTIPKFAQSVDEKKNKRWNEIALAAAKQSGFPFKPTVHSIASFSELFEALPNTDNKLLLWEGEKQRDLKSYFSSPSYQQDKSSTLIIGPEGGFAEHEVNLAKKAGAVSLSLGHQILRVETASLAALTLVQFHTGNMSLT